MKIRQAKKIIKAMRRGPHVFSWKFYTEQKALNKTMSVTIRRIGYKGWWESFKRFHGVR
jgi:hypothetical protein